jgi:predicted thioesterase
MLDLSRLEPGLKGSASLRVEDAQTAARVGSGTVAVFATPMMVALMEAAAVDCVEWHLPEGCVSLGTRLDITHTAPTPVGMTVTASAVLTGIDGRVLSFEVEARDEREPIGKGVHTRVVVELNRFEAKLAAKCGGSTGR